MERLDRVSDSRLTIPGLFSMLLSTKLTARTKERIVTKIPSYLFYALRRPLVRVLTTRCVRFTSYRARRKRIHINGGSILPEPACFALEISLRRRRLSRFPVGPLRHFFRSIGFESARVRLLTARSDHSTFRGNDTCRLRSRIANSKRRVDESRSSSAPTNDF